jgi:hypothetical protein
MVGMWGGGFQMVRRFLAFLVLLSRVTSRVVV